MPNICKMCVQHFSGRIDKVFCSINCKNEYHVKLRRVTQVATLSIDRILHRNRSILLEIMGKNAVQKKVHRQVLDQKKFNYKYHTHSYLNSRGKRYYYVYDFSWMEFSTHEVLINRNIKKANK